MVKRCYVPVAEGRRGSAQPASHLLKAATGERQTPGTGSNLRRPVLLNAV